MEMFGPGGGGFSGSSSSGASSGDVSTGGLSFGNYGSSPASNLMMLGAIVLVVYLVGRK